MRIRSRGGRASSYVVSGALVSLALCVGLAEGTARASLPAGHPDVAASTGERDADVGPTTARVDPQHATPEAATSALLAPEAAPSSPDRVHAAAQPDPAVRGRWRTLDYRLPLNTIHATLLHTGQFLLIAGSGNAANNNVIADFKAYLWNPRTGRLRSVPVPYDAFCAGHLVAPNGDVIVFGGTVKYKDENGPWIGSDRVYRFKVATSTWQAMPRMKQGRWYPTNLVDGHRRLFAFSGKDANGATPPTHEMFHPTNRRWRWAAPSRLPLYPGLHLLKNGRIAYTGAHFGGTYARSRPRTFAPLLGKARFVRDPKGVMNLPRRNSAMSALVGSAHRQLAWVAGGGFPAVRSTYFIDFNTTRPRAVGGPRLRAAKAYVSISHLPNLYALETGGGTGTDSPVYEASILNPHTRKLTPVAPPRVPRTYHSSSLTMPDGRVVTFGGDPAGDDRFELRIEIFSPPYLFRGRRPTIAAAPRLVRYGRAYTVRASARRARLTSAVIMRPGSATHAVDANQRVLELQAKRVPRGLRVRLPRNPHLAPPGWYLLFVNDGKGRPSVGRWIRLR